MPLSEPCLRTSQLARVPSGSWRLWERMNKGNCMNHWVPVALCSQPKLANASSVRNQVYTQQIYADEDLSNHYTYSQHCYHDGPDTSWQKRNREWVSVLVSQSHLQRVDTTCNVCQRNAPQFNYIQTQKNQTYRLAAVGLANSTNIHKHVPRTQPGALRTEFHISRMVSQIVLTLCISRQASTVFGTWRF